MFFKKKYTYRDYTQIGYKSVNLRSVPDRKLRIKDICISSIENLHNISDNGFKGVVSCNNIDEELVAKCGFYVETNMGGHFCSTIKESIKTYLIKQQEYESKNPLLNYRFSMDSISKKSQVAIYDGLILNFIREGICPIYIGNFTEVLEHENLIYGFKDSLNNVIKRSVFELDSYLPPPRIEYGMFYTKDQKIVHRLSENLFQTRNIKVRVPDLSGFSFFLPDTTEFGNISCFTDDILYYNNYNSYLSEYKSQDRQEKISTILNEFK